MDLQAAIAISCEAHKNQLDKAGEPYILHPLRLMFQFEDTHLRIIAVLHDVVEDSNLTINDLQKKGFDKKVLDALECLTKKENESYEQFIDRVSKNVLATVVKIADLKDNMNISRLAQITEKDLLRLKKYHSALNKLSRL
jgi:(p)ppGpp synthase/HD superfamily hydrolase